MKKITLYLATLIALLLTAPVAIADQRDDRDTNNCHIAPDPNDDDAEIDLACTLFNSQVNRFVDVDGVRKASGSMYGLYRVPLGNARVRHPLIVPNSAGDIFLVGKENTRYLRGDYVTAANTECNMVRSNFQANTDNDDQNQTQYTSNDWDLTIKWKGYEDKEGDILEPFNFTDVDEFDYDEDGVVSLSDFTTYRREYMATEQIGIWHISRNCRRGIAQ